MNRTLRLLLIISVMVFGSTMVVAEDVTPTVPPVEPRQLGTNPQGPNLLASDPFCGIKEELNAKCDLDEEYNRKVCLCKSEVFLPLGERSYPEWEYDRVEGDPINCIGADGSRAGTVSPFAFYCIPRGERPPWVEPIDERLACSDLNKKVDRASQTYLFRDTGGVYCKDRFGRKVYNKTAGICIPSSEKLAQVIKICKEISKNKK